MLAVRLTGQFADYFGNIEQWATWLLHGKTFCQFIIPVNLSSLSRYEFLSYRIIFKKHHYSNLQPAVLLASGLQATWSTRTIEAKAPPSNLTVNYTF